MHIAIVGASGLIGSAVADALVERGDVVVDIVRSNRTTAHGRPHRVWDPSVADAPPGFFDGCEVVVNVAGAPLDQRWSPDAWRAIEASRVDATRRIVAAAERDGVRVLITASAVGYYGTTEDPVDESAPPGEGPLADLCVRWEAAAESESMRVVRLRTGIVLAASGGALGKMATPAKLGLGGPIAGGRQWLPWIHVRDVVGLVLWALDEGVRGPVNLVAPQAVRQGEFAATLGRVLRRPALMPIPGFALRLMLGEAASIVTTGQQVVPAVARSGGYRFAFPELEAALRDLLG